MNSSLPIHQDADENDVARLKSRKPAWKTARNLADIPFRPDEARKQEWARLHPHGLINIDDPTAKPPGFNLPSTIWTRLNRIRCGVGRTASALHQWGWLESPSCNCGAEVQTISHIVKECPLRAFTGPVEELHQVTPAALTWLEGLDISL